MSSVPYRDPYRLPAGLLALAVHGAFFLLLYLGFNWQSVQPQAMSVELWQSLPDTVPNAMPPPPAPEAAAAEPVKPVRVAEPVKPEIAMSKSRTDAKKAAVKPAETRPDKIKPEAAKKSDAKSSKQSEEERRIDEQAAREQEEFEKSERELAAREQENLERAEREQANAIGRVVDEYKARINAKIKRGLVMPPDVNRNARAEFVVTLLPGGRVLKVELKKSSGNALYDTAVERAILKSTPLPLPPDVELFERFRELKLVFKPVD